MTFWFPKWRSLKHWKGQTRSLWRTWLSDFDFGFVAAQWTEPVLKKKTMWGGSYWVCCLFSFKLKSLPLRSHGDKDPQNQNVLTCHKLPEKNWTTPIRPPHVQGLEQTKRPDPWQEQGVCWPCHWSASHVTQMCVWARFGRVLSEFGVRGLMFGQLLDLDALVCILRLRLSKKTAGPTLP